MNLKNSIVISFSILLLISFPGCDIDEPVGPNSTIEGRLKVGNLPLTNGYVMLNYKPPIIKTSPAGYFKFELPNLTIPYNLFLNYKNISILNVSLNNIDANLEYISHEDGYQVIFDNLYYLTFPQRNEYEYSFFLQSDDVSYFNLGYINDSARTIKCVIKNSGISNINILAIKSVYNSFNTYITDYSFKTFSDLNNSIPLRFTDDDFIPITSYRRITVSHDNSNEVFSNLNFYYENKSFHKSFFSQRHDEKNTYIFLPDFTGFDNEKIKMKVRFSNSPFIEPLNSSLKQFSLLYEIKDFIEIIPFDLSITSPENNSILNLSNDPKISVNYSNSIFVYRVILNNDFFSIVTDKNYLYVKEILEIDKSLSIPFDFRVSVMAIEGFNNINDFLSQRERIEYNKVVSTNLLKFRLEH
jgi:hypothetical protein